MVKRTGVALLALLVALGAQAQGDGDDSRRRLLDQKLRLVETLLRSPAANEREGEAAALIEQARGTVAEARRALAEGRFDEATTLADGALRSVSSATRRGAVPGALTESAQRKSLDDVGSQLASYRESLVELTRDAKAGADAKTLLDKLDAARAESEKLAGGGQLGEANRVLSGAYRLAVEEIARLRAGQEVVMSLKFASPAEEYAYDQRRFASNEILVEQMLAQGKGEGGRQALVDRYVGEARKLRDDAEGRAVAGEHVEAIALMEKAVTQLNRALQALGVPVF